MILATSQVANTVANLKSRYYKYLETLCSSNGIEIGTLKTNGSDYEELEMFFGGLPVLIGLKYFERLKCLRLFGQDIVNLKPLIEVSNTLEELWDLAGIEVCKKLQKLYLFDCKIEDGTQLGKLIGLDTLWIMNNNLKDLEFLDHLQQLIVLYIGGKQFNDSTAMSVQIWPHKLQELDIGGNEIKSFQVCFLF
uniref:Uncharacterized protein n=1 Tax=Panagrolaimus superbus TaxID=310955 RepID=A0A914YY08_9BILA